MSDADLYEPIEKTRGLFEQLTPDQQKAVLEYDGQPARRPRYYFERDEIVTTSVVHDGCDNCDCHDCRDFGPTSELEEIIYGYSIIDRLRGQYNPIGFVYDADQAEKIVSALNLSTL